MVRTQAHKHEGILSARRGEFFTLSSEVSPGRILSSEREDSYSLSQLSFPEPVIAAALNAGSEREKVVELLRQYSMENPTLRYSVDDETSEIVVEGMGELHLGIIVDRLRDEHGIKVTLGDPKVKNRERPTKEAAFDYTLKKQSGGRGMVAHLIGVLGPGEEEFAFTNETTGATLPTEYVAACEKGFKACSEKGTLIGAPVVNYAVLLTGGSHHVEDSSREAFRRAAGGTFRDFFPETDPEIIEPLAIVHVTCPEDYVRGAMGTLGQREGRIMDNEVSGGQSNIRAKVPLRRMFGYITDLRSVTGGFGDFSMELSGGYRKVPEGIARDLIRAASE